MYHRVLTKQQIEKASSDQAIIVQDRTFFKQIKFLKKKFHSLSTSEFENCLLNKESFPDFSCFITFDDGWKDNFQNAYNILRQFETPAIIFLTTGYIGTNNIFWQEKFRRLIGKLLEDKNLISALNRDFPQISQLLNFQNLPGSNEIARQEWLNKRIKKLKLLSADQRKTLLNDLETFDYKINDNTENPNRFLDWSDILVMAKNNIAFGSHSVNHILLDQVNHSEMSNELYRSKEEIESKTGTTVSGFAYPNGNYNSAIISELKKSSYTFAFCTKTGYVDTSTDPFLIPRINIQQYQSPHFQEELP